MILLHTQILFIFFYTIKNLFDFPYHIFNMWSSIAFNFNDWQMNFLILFFYLINFIYYHNYYFFWKKILKTTILFFSLLFSIHADKLVGDYYIIDCEINELFTGLLSLHPFIFYCAFLQFLLIFYSRKSMYIIHLFIRTKLYILVFISILSGGYWGYSQPNWGSWWTWDIIDLLLLTFLLTCIVNLHTYCVLRNKKYNYFYFLFFISVLISIRLGLFNSKHTFFSPVLTDSSQGFFIKCILLICSSSFCFLRTSIAESYLLLTGFNFMQIISTIFINLVLIIIFFFLNTTTHVMFIYTLSFISFLLIAIISFSIKCVHVQVKNKRVIMHCFVFTGLMFIFLALEPGFHTYFKMIKSIINLPSLQIQLNGFFYDSGFVNTIFYEQRPSLQEILLVDYQSNDMLHEMGYLDFIWSLDNFVYEYLNFVKSNVNNSLVLDFFAILLYKFFTIIFFLIILAYIVCLN